MGIAILSAVVVKEMKEKIWNGARQETISLEYFISQATVSRIVSGKQWGQIPWPDGSNGAMSPERRMLLHQKGAAFRNVVQQATISSGVLESGNVVDFARRVEELAERREMEDLTRSMADVGMSGDEPESSELHIPKWDGRKWEAIRALAPNNPLVREAAEDRAAQVAIIEVFRHLPEQDWGKDIAFRLYRQVLATIQEK